MPYSYMGPTVRKLQSIHHNSMGPTVRILQNIIRHDFKDTRLLWEAVQAPASIVRTGEIEGAGVVRHSVGFYRFVDGNKRLALLGDTVLRLSLVENWYNGYENREKVSRILASSASNENLDRVARKHNIDRFVNTNPAQSNNPAPIIMAGTIEAILGAVYLDGGMKSVDKVIQNLGIVPRVIRKIVLRDNEIPLPAAKAINAEPNAPSGAPSPDEGAVEPPTVQPKALVPGGLSD